MLTLFKNVGLEMERNKERYQFLNGDKMPLKTHSLFLLAQAFAIKLTWSFLPNPCGPKKRPKAPWPIQTHWLAQTVTLP